MAVSKPDTIPEVLACDCGNSALRTARVCADQVQDLTYFDALDPAGLAESIKSAWGRMDDPRSIAACSVNPELLEKLEAAVRDATDKEVLLVGRDLALPMPMKVTDPGSVGTDRVCAAVAAYDRLGTACVVADFGSATTIDCVDADGAFLGGAIMPGLGLSADVLARSCAALPQIELSEPEGVFGQDTINAIRNGIINGARGALRCLVEAYASELNSWPSVILTGGGARLICPEIRSDGVVQAIVEDLTLRGVAMAYYKSLIE
jgi:type III pantothenate kinase